MTDRACITGIGVATPTSIGRGVPALLVHEPSGEEPRPREGVPVPEPALIVATRSTAEDALHPRALRKVSEHTRFVTVAASQCLEDAGIEDEGLRQDTGLALGTSFGCSSYHLEYHEALRRRGVTGASALLFTQSVFNAATGHVGQLFGLRGSNITFVGGEAVGLEAIARAAKRVELGSDRVILAGGAEQYSDLVHASLDQSGLLRDGAPFAEGAVLLAVELESTANARGSAPIARILGTGHARGERALEAAVSQVVERAGVSVDSIEHKLLCEAIDAGAGHASRFDELVGAPTIEDTSGSGFAMSSAWAVARGVAAGRTLVAAATARGAFSAILVDRVDAD